jgi:hypothetical protein
MTRSAGALSKRRLFPSVPSIQANGSPVPGNALANHKITVSGNAFVGSGGSAIFANAVEGLTIESNRIERTASPAVVFGAVKQVVLKDNRCAPPSTVTLPPASVGQVASINNSGLLMSSQP